MIREENARAINDSDDVVRLATPSTQASIEGWTFNKKYDGPKKRQRLLNDFVKKEYGAQEVIDDYGFSWYEWEPVDSDYIKAFSAAPLAVGIEDVNNKDKE